MDRIRRVELHSIDRDAFEGRLRLKPVAIALSIALGTSTLTGCDWWWEDDDNNGGGSSSDIPGTNFINTSGGTGHSPGGDGGDVYFYIGGLNAVLEVLSSISSAPSISSFPATPDFGANLLSVSSSMTLPITGTEPAIGMPYQVDNNCNVYVSNGNTTLGDEAPVTGLDVQAGATLSMETHSGSGAACVDTANDMNNDGVLTTVSDGANLWLYADNYFGSGDIDTSGKAEGSSAGDIYVGTSGSHYSTGDFLAMGADSTSGDAGHGGNIDLYTNGLDLWTGGVANSSGGMSTVGLGGDAAVIEMHLEDGPDGGTFLRTGETISRGGDGETGGGAGYYIWFEVDPPSTPGGKDTDMFITASMDTSGGDGLGTPAPGGPGAEVYLYSENTENGKLVLFGFGGGIDTSGGSGSTVGGTGGDVAFEADNDYSHMLNKVAINARGGDATDAAGSNGAGSGGNVGMYGGFDGMMTNNGPVDTSGGNAVSGYGGNGGDIEFYRDGNNNAGTNTITNTAPLTADGGDGTLGGGSGGYVELYNYMDVAGTDTVSNSGPISTTGGSATTGSGGSGGNVKIEQDSGAGNVTNTANIDTSGGDSDSGSAGNAGYIEVEIEDGDGFVSSSGMLTANGGNSVSGSGGNGNSIEVEQESSDGVGGTTAAAGSGSQNTGALSTAGGSGAYGGDGGSVDFYSPGLPSSNSGPINASGGDGTQDGGDGGVLQFAYGEPFTNSGDADLSGGDGTAGYGGNGGSVDMYSTGGTTTSNSGNMNVAGGTGGAGNGTDGTVTIDGVVQ